MVSMNEKNTQSPQEFDGDQSDPEQDTSGSLGQQGDAANRLRKILSAARDAKLSEFDREQLLNQSSTNEQPSGGGWYGEDEISLDTAGSYKEKSDQSPVNSGLNAEYDLQEDQQTRPSIEMGDTPQNQTVINHYISGDDEPTIPPVPVFLDSQPLPQQVDEVDRFATKVTPSAYQSSRRTRPGRQAPQPPAGATPPAGTRIQQNKQPLPPKNRKISNKKTTKGRRSFLFKLFVGLLFAFVFIGVVIASFGVYEYFSIVSGLPPVDNLAQHASQFETTRILDRDGNTLYEIIDPNAGRRTYVTLDKISPYLIAATIATEDKEYYNHPGYDFLGMMRALWQNYTSGEIVSGASTITQQLARTLLFTQDERIDKSYDRKAREIVLAAEITRRYSKEDILELYLNENNYGKSAYGIEAAAQTYFHTSSQNLDLAQASFLAGIPQTPAIYDITTNREDTLNRHKQVLTLVYQYNQEKGCIYVSNNAQPVCVTADEAIQAARDIENYTFVFAENDMLYPHWVNYVRALLEEEYGPQTIFRSGFNVYTTIDPAIQVKAQELVKNQVSSMVDKNVTGGAVVVLQPATGEILAMVGSPDFYNEESSGQVNMAVSPRQPGSSIKPLTYAAAFEKGWTPATLIWDVPSEFTPSGLSTDPSPKYLPVNYDGRFHGPVTVRSALANSFNVPAVKALEYVGVYDDPTTERKDGFIPFAERLGITTLTRPDYGLSLTLGGGEVTLLEMTGAFSIFANNGRMVEPVAITKITNYKGELVYEYKQPAGDQVIRAEHAFLINSILSDNSARTPMFGANSVLNLPFQAAAKTGTTNDFRDNWTMGYTPDVVIGVWIGNPDYTPMVNTTGLSGAAPIWSELMVHAINVLTNNLPTPFSKPALITDRIICEVSGAEPSEFCPSQRSEYFAIDQPPLPKEDDLWKKIEIDTWTGLTASGECNDFTEEKVSVNVTDPWAIKWIKESDQGRGWAESMGFDDPIFFTPERICKISDPRPTIFFSNLNENQKITDKELDIYAVVHADNYFDNFRLEWGKGDDPDDFEVLKDNIKNQYMQPELIYTWNLEDIKAGKITLRIYMTSSAGTFAEKKLVLNIQVPTPTPTLTRTPTETPTSTSTPEPTFTPTNTETPQPTFTITATSTATATLTATTPPAITEEPTAIP